MRIYVLDSTLQDGTRHPRVSLTPRDKLSIAHRLDEFGIDFIDGGWPSSNPADREFFALAAAEPFKHSRLTAFAALDGPGKAAAADPELQAALATGAPVICLSGETLPDRIHSGGKADEYLRSVYSAVQNLKGAGREVIYNAENFFDAYQDDPILACSLLEAAHRAGADILCLCDSRGGTLTRRLAEICEAIRARFHGSLGIHAHNDSGLAVANTLAAVDQGFDHVQGCVNGYGERCGCANLCSIIPNLELKAGHTVVGRDRLEQLNPLARFVAEVANLSVPSEAPYVGLDAFEHCGLPWLENDHTRPEYVGNCVRPTSLAWKLSTDPMVAKLGPNQRRELFDAIRLRETEGYDLTAANGTFELLVRELASPETRFFDVLGYEAAIRSAAGSGVHTTASVTLDLAGAVSSAEAAGDGPVHALELALRNSLVNTYPEILETRLLDYKVRVLDPHAGAAARVRVMADWSDGDSAWTTAGVSTNIIEASWIALVSSAKLHLLRKHETGLDRAPSADYSWAV